MRIGRAQQAVMQFDCPFSDGQAKPNASAGAAAVFFHAIERIENVGQSLFGNAAAEVAHARAGKTDPDRFSATSTRSLSGE